LGFSPTDTAYSRNRYQQGEEKYSDTENVRENGLRMKNEMTMKEKRFSFFSHPQERKTESQPTFGTLPFARHTSQRFAKVKEPNFSDSPTNTNKQNNSNLAFLNN